MPFIDNLQTFGYPPELNVLYASCRMTAVAVTVLVFAAESCVYEYVI
uniref:Uncharacterized protein n=1 Tax=Siphoviridae sp. ctBmU27 TaxID=2826189 RepID=A0A8S5NA64_9CAUD|nr:MAG TPA: hypothetical protein [Siphoviridae sp. ctBmU27]